MNETIPRFDELGITPELLNIISKYFQTPTAIQHKVIPTAIKGQDVVGVAQTGTGKTLAFGVPMLQRIFLEQGQGIVILPTRELALQVDEMLRKIAGPKFRTAVLIGGASMWQQKQSLRRNPHVVVATPGRLMDHLQQRSYSLATVKIVVLDEADRMLDIGFLPQIKQILSKCPVQRQTMLFSATMPIEVSRIATQYMKNPVRVEVEPSGTVSAKIEQGVFIMDRKDKIHKLKKLLNENDGTILVFVRTKHGARKITTSLRDIGHKAAEIHSNRSLAQRKEAIAGFKGGRYRILVATDIASRGIDVKDISLVINYDLPENREDYVHRIGRTGRAGKTGKALSFVTYEEKRYIRRIEQLIAKRLPIISVEPRSFKAPVRFR
ncbi:MAG: DEAD/DEAH box helicase, ATP-dependent RNA helicase RhlE [Candidatus Peregrinibacteria bacterium GW2011_GWF2_33_10]|nr:MAG: DEAD/DEAH box helicase, ATP-dependent RNA helicase RhlE [Candidatus Peregrinibacteria bacterium GW2011_GWF2_33_10]OGJ45072.1 MAG: hypothetical protein A2263_02455 [Candidatus Peregrinibacteria bacterium RIFOXYA2_FULL_33_21]OGJ46065.1 MAG: hypothetical protein A2272_02100 [Candidatus Peregrinibacteria bacterium RIFOXYA12_FULL_33_12]OGJ50844.1 MAG: hypothetical protein A2307_00600 [Candidatus Peregrinibacteria bacterium RIFOXYB2_FULL_33_20]